MNAGMRDKGREASGWSDELKQRTRELIAGGGLDFLPFDDKLHMKNWDDRFGYILLSHLYAKTLIVMDKEAKTEAFFGSVDDLIASGWVID